jgi:hypothetical protein
MWELPVELKALRSKVLRYVRYECSHAPATDRRHGSPSSLECDDRSRIGHGRQSPPWGIHVVWSFDGSSLIKDCNDQLGSFTGPILVSLLDHRAHRLCAYFLGRYNAMTKLRPCIDCEDKVMSFHRERGLQDPNNVIGLTLASMMPYAVPFCSMRVYPLPGFMDGTTDPHTV